MPGLRIGPTWRMLSPSGVSILVTSAPMEASSWVAYGPMITEVISSILTPASGPERSFMMSFRLDAGLFDQGAPVNQLALHIVRELTGTGGRSDLKALLRQLVLDIL